MGLPLVVRLPEITQLLEAVSPVRQSKLKGVSSNSREALSLSLPSLPNP